MLFPSVWIVKEPPPSPEMVKATNQLKLVEALQGLMAGKWDVELNYDLEALFANRDALEHVQNSPQCKDLREKLGQPINGRLQERFQEALSRARTVASPASPTVAS